MEAEDWIYRSVDGILEFFYDRDVKSQEDVDEKYKGQGAKHMSDGSKLNVEDSDGNIIETYTFTNDHINNVNGSVEDSKGNILDSNQITYNSKFTIFGTCDTCVNAATLHKNYMGSSYTGPNNPKDYNGKDSFQFIPRNFSEIFSMQHDKEYTSKEASGVPGALFDKSVTSADLKLVYKNMVNPLTTGRDRIRSGITALAFGLILSTTKK